MFQPSSRTQIAPFLAMEVAAEANAMIAGGRSIVRFDVGQPATGAPPQALAAAQAAMAGEALGYTEALGRNGLRARLSRWYGEAYGLEVDPGRIIITTGASASIQLAALALFATGDRIAMAAPGYPPYRHILTALGMDAALIEAEPETGLQLTPEALRAAAHAGAIAGALAASPANPTGAMLSTADLEALCAAAADLSIPLIMDEIYHGLTYAGPAATALRFSDEAFIVNSFSKYWAMTGWRIGWLIAPERFVKPIERLAQSLYISPPTISQVAAGAALDDRSWCEGHRAVYARNHALILDAAPKLGLPVVTRPDGAFYALIDVTAHSVDSRAFCQAALHEAGVALTPGIDFDERRGAGWVRLAFARSHEEIQEGVRRLAAWLK